MRLRVLATLSLACGVTAQANFQQFWADSTSWSPEGAEANGTLAVQAQVERLLPTEFQHLFDFNLDYSLDNDTTHDSFKIVTLQPSLRIQINASSTVGLSRALFTYLKTRGGIMTLIGSTYSSQLLGAKLDNATSWEGSSWVSWRYMFNPVQFSYKTAWWDWPKWEWLLDWASMHGVNLALAVGGQEIIWAEVYRDFGMSDDEIYQYFAGPAFLAYQRLGHIQGSWGGQLSQGFISKQWTMQKQIIKRMVALGMTPILPAFTGYIPAGLHQYLGGPEPNTGLNWQGLPSQYTEVAVLDPTWDSFKTVQAAFLKKQSEMYGGWTSHYYSINLWDAQLPTSTDSDYLQSNTQAVIASLRDVDPQAVGILQAGFVNERKDVWTPTAVEALLSGAQNDEIIVLDLASEALPVWNSTDSFYGKPWVWNLMMNYGGADGMYGSLDHYVQEVIRAKQASPNLVGVGLTPESWDSNEIVFALVFETPWSTTVVDPIQFARGFATRRYGIGLPGMANGTQFIMDAWQAIVAVAYNNTDTSIQGVPKSIVELQPAIEGLVNRTGRQPTKLSYSPPDLVTACNNLLAGGFNAPQMVQMPLYQFDMVMCTKQILFTTSSIIYEQAWPHSMLTEWSKTTNATGMSQLGDLFLDLVKDIDRVVAVNRQMLFSTTIGEARSWGDTLQEQDFLEYQARNLAETWGPAPNSSASWSFDRYGSPQLAGVIGGLYHGCWSILVEYLKYTPPSQYNQTLIDASVRAYELSWSQQQWGSFANQTWTISTDDLLGVIAQFRPKWGYWFEQSWP